MKNYKCIVDKTLFNTEKAFRDELTRLLELYGKTFKIDTKKRLALFLANVKAEIRVLRGGKVSVRESLNYTPEGLISTFKYFRTHRRLAWKYGRTKEHRANQRAIANLAYGYRLGNRGQNTDDGYRYRGVGILQDTGRANILKDSKLLEEMLDIKVLNKDGEPFEGLYDSYFGAILLGFAFFYRTKMWQCGHIDCAVDIINKYTKSRGKRRALYYKVLKKIKECERE